MPIRVGHPAEQIREPRQVSGTPGVQAVQRIDDVAEG